MLILKIHNLSYGFSGVGEDTLRRIQWHIDSDIIPIVPSQGSVGASGDLAPLAHLFLPLIGLGEVQYKGKIISAEKMLILENKKPIKLGPKEGLALINGTQFIAAHAAAASLAMSNLIDHADLIGAIMIEGLLGSTRPFMDRLHQLRAYRGCIESANNIYRLVEGSSIHLSHHGCDRVQDPYSLRCMPQVHGAVRNALYHFDEMLSIEMNSVTDNPVIFSKEMIISGGNFHGEPMAMPIDYLCLGASELSSISDRRIYLSLEGKTTQVPKLLMNDTGINSGFMILQYTSAALASENKGMCFPASADSIPTSLGQEDHVSMGSIGGRKLIKVIENTEKVLAIELMCAAQAIEFHRPLTSSLAIEKVLFRVRQEIPFLEKDELFYPHIEKSIEILKSGELLALANLKQTTDV
jgi:histidine ammonia-lyase